jgi:predicted alpha/beta-hydrolase family hydrolase
MNADRARSITLDVSDDITVSAKVDAPRHVKSATPGLLLAHGANNDLDHPLLTAVAAALSQEDVAIVLRFNFPYVERTGTSPDPHSVLETTYRRAHDLLVDELLESGAPVFLGGKSLGGRIAAELVSRREEGEGLQASGLVVFGYPLHAPGRRDRPHLEPLRRIGIPSLFFIGSRDPFCEPDLLRPVLAGLAHPGRMYVVEEGDHSLRLAKSSGRGAEDAYGAVCAETAAFIRAVCSLIS